MITHALFAIILPIILLLATVFWIWMLVDCAKNKSLASSHKLLWFLVIFFTHLIGALAYFIIGRSTNKVAAQPGKQAAAPTQQR